MPTDQWYTKQGPDGQWYKAQAASQDAAVAKMEQAWRPKQYLPEVNAALASAPGKPSIPPEHSFWSDKASDYAPVGRQFLSPDMQPIQRRPTPEWSGVYGPGQMAQGVEQMAEGGRKDIYQGGAKAISGAFETATPMMLAGAVASPTGAVKAFAGSMVGGYGAGKLSKVLGGSPEAQQFWNEIGSLTGAGVGGAEEFLKGKYSQAVENAKGDLRAARPAGGQVDEAALQKAAEAKVQIDIAKGNTLPELSKTAAQVVIKAAQSGLFANRDEQLPEQFGKHAEAKLPESKPIPTEPDVHAKIKDLQAQLEQTHQAEIAKTQTRPMTQPEKVEQLKPKPIETAKPPEVVKPKVLKNQPVDLEVKEPSVQDRVAKIKEVAGITSKEVKRAPENMFVEDVFRRGMQLRQEGLTEPEQVATLMKEYPQHADEIARAFQTKRPEVGGSKPGPSGTQFETKPVQTPEATKRPGEPVRTTEKSSLEGDFVVKQKKQAEDLIASQPPAQAPKLQEKVGFSTAPSPEPRSRRGDLGERPPQPPAAKTPALPDKAVFDQRVQEYLKRHPNMAEGTAKRFVAEAMQKERGSLGGSSGAGWGPGGREARMKIYLDVLRDEKSSPEALDQAYKVLTKIFDMSHDDIIQRMAGGAEFAKTPEKSPIEERLEPNAELDRKADSLLGGLHDMVDRALSKHPDVERSEQNQRAAFDGKLLREVINPKDSYETVRTIREHGFRLDRAETGTNGELIKYFKNDRGDGIALRFSRDNQGRTLTAARFEGVEAGPVGTPEIPGIKDPAREELERMFNLKDERGFWTMFPDKKPRPPRQSVNALDDLTAKLESSMKAVPPDDSRMRLAERLDKTITEGWDKVQMSIGRMGAQAVALKDMYMRPPEQGDYNTSIGRFSGALNRSVWELRQFTKAIKEKLPEPRRREAITNWIQAGGDDAILADRATRSKGSLRAGYEAARALTDDEKNLAGFIQNHFERRLKEAIQMDVLKDGLDNYVPQIWKPKDQQNMQNFFSVLHRSGLLKTDFNAAKRRVFESYFEGEQAGHTPVNKDIGFLVASWDKAFNQAIASRTLVRDLSAGLAKDGRPIVAPSGTGKAIYETGSQSPETGEKPSAYVIYPKAGPDETGDYRLLDHSALTKWTWATKDADGTPIFMKGDLRVHPDHAQKLDNVINRGKWAQAHPVQTALLKGSGFFKATLLSMSPFHQIQEGTHALFHKVNPFNPKAIDLADPRVGRLLDHGLVIGNFDPAAAFDEGLAAGGLAGKVPGLGQYLQKYSDYLFGDYIPRLKTQMAVEAYDRNLKRFDGAIQAGKITTNQIAEITSNQANAAFGELNYITMGRSPQTQALLRFAFLAPDFLEARARFAGQALTPFGREQQAALIRGAVGLYVSARVVNQVLDDDPHWDRPFSLVIKGYEYKMRSLPGDIWNLLQEPSSFVMHRLNPTMTKPLGEMMFGKDDFGRKRDLGGQAIDFVKGVVPIPLQSFTRSGGEGRTVDRLETGAMSSFGITRSKYRSDAAALAHQYALGSNPNDITSHHIQEIVQDISENRLDAKRVRELILSGQMNPKDLQTAIKLAMMPEIYRDYYRLPVELKAKVFAKATPKERAILNAYARKELDTTRLLPEQRAQFMKDFTGQ
jgi:hypothetical protein